MTVPQKAGWQIGILSALGASGIFWIATQVFNAGGFVAKVNTTEVQTKENDVIVNKKIDDLAKEFHDFAKEQRDENKTNRENIIKALNTIIDKGEK